MCVSETEMRKRSTFSRKKAQGEPEVELTKPSTGQDYTRPPSKSDRKIQGSGQSSLQRNAYYCTHRNTHERPASNVEAHCTSAPRVREQSSVKDQPKASKNCAQPVRVVGITKPVFHRRRRSQSSRLGSKAPHRRVVGRSRESKNRCRSKPRAGIAHSPHHAEGTPVVALPSARGHREQKENHWEGC